jgi:hypothetical protein
MSDEFGTLDDLLSAVASPDPKRRGHAAHRIQDFAEAAVDALFRAIARSENRNHRGTLVFVLRSFNCEDRFTELFDLALHGHYEVQNHALSILQGQSFDVTAEQLRQAEHVLGELRERENLSAEEVELLRGELRCVLSRLRKPTIAV